jgi:hypothetical protein
MDKEDTEMAMDYSKIGDWILKEDSFDAEHLGI